MPLGTPTLATPTVSGTSGTVTTASFLPTGSALLLAFGGVRQSALPGAVAISGGSLTWTVLAEALRDIGAGVRMRCALYAAIAPSSPSAMTVTASSSGGATMVAAVVQITGAGGLPGNAAGADHESGDPTVVLPSAPAASSTVVCFGAFQSTVTVSEPTGFTEISELIASDVVIEVAYDNASAPTSFGYVTTNFRSVATAVEVVQPSSAGAALRLQRSGTRAQHLLVR